MTSEFIFIGDLSPRHQRALRLMVEKYRRGALEHGDLEGGKRWTRAMLEEQIDKNFYMLFDLMEMEDAEA
jgi:hypothetical protein